MELKFTPKYPCQHAMVVRTGNTENGVMDPLSRPKLDVICGALRYESGIYGFFMLDPFADAQGFMQNTLCYCQCPHIPEEEKQPMPEEWVVTSDLELRRRR
jgi:hypothetical protein